MSNRRVRFVLGTEYLGPSNLDLELYYPGPGKLIFGSLLSLFYLPKAKRGEDGAMSAISCAPGPGIPLVLPIERFRDIV